MGELGPVPIGREVETATETRVRDMSTPEQGDDTTLTGDGSERSGPDGESGERERFRAPGEGDFRDRLEAVADRLPLAAGSFIGATALLIPYIVITVVTSVAADRGNALSVAADMFFTIVTFGPGERFVNGFVSVAAVSSLENVRPGDYPSIEPELEASLSILRTEPEAALLLLYIAGPWIFYLGGRYLARHYATAETPTAFATAGATVVAGTVPVTLVLGLLFGQPTLLRTVLLFGAVVPAVLGAVGGLSVYVFRREHVALSKGIGWLGVFVGILATFVLSPWLPYSLDLAQRASVSGMGFLAAASVTVPATPLTVLIFVLVALSAIGAGYLRVSLAREAIDSAIDGIRPGASVVLGYLGAVALLGAALPLTRILIGIPDDATRAFATAQPNVGGYLWILLVAGVLFPLICCSIGGYLAARSIEADSLQRL